MIPAQYYHSLYLLIVTALSIYSYVEYGKVKTDNVEIISVEKKIIPVLLTVFMIIFIGTRPISGKYFWDMAGTASVWDWWSQGDEYVYQWGYTNKLYDNLRALMSTYGLHIKYFFILIACIYFSCIYYACKKFFPKNTLYALLVYYIAFSTYSYATNGIKAGSAAALFLVALAYYKNWKIMIPFVFLSWGFHHSMIMVVCSFISVYFYRNSKHYFILWLFALLIAAMHITMFQSFFAKLSDESGAEYLMKQVHGKGFRLDFIAYSSVPVFIGYYYIYIKKIQAEQYITLLNLYLMTNSIWMLCMYSEFTNRISYLSWFLHPWVMIYPFIYEMKSENQIKNVNIISFSHLAFNLFMTLIYW